MRRRRADLDIYAAILKAIAGRHGVTKTQIMYFAHIGFRQLQKYLDLLLEHDLVTEVEWQGRMSYEVTAEGKLFLEHYGKVRELVTTEK